MIDNERGGRKETMGLWAWKIETLQPGEKAIIEFGLDNLERGNWTETEVFYRGSAEVIGANKLDEKILAELKIQNDDFISEKIDIKDEIDETISNVGSRAMKINSHEEEIQTESYQTTLFNEEEVDE